MTPLIHLLRAAAGRPSPVAARGVSNRRCLCALSATGCGRPGGPLLCWTGAQPLFLGAPVAGSWGGSSTRVPRRRRAGSPPPAPQTVWLTGGGGWLLFNKDSSCFLGQLLLPRGDMATRGSELCRLPFHWPQESGWQYQAGSIECQVLSTGTCPEGPFWLPAPPATGRRASVRPLIMTAGRTALLTPRPLERQQATHPREGGGGGSRGLASARLGGRWLRRALPGSD